MSETQKELWNGEDLPERPEIVAKICAGSFIGVGAEKQISGPKPNGGVTGKKWIAKLLSDDELCYAICSALVAGVSVKLVAKRFQINVRSVRKIKEAMRDRGELAPVRLRIQALLDQFVEEGLEAMNEGVISGAIHPGQLPIPVLAAIDKRAQLEVNVVPGTGRTARQITADDLAAELQLMDQMKPAIEVDTDTESVVSDHKSLEGNGHAELDTLLDTKPATEPAVQDPGLGKVDGQMDAEKGGRGSADFGPGGLEPLGQTD